MGLRLNAASAERQLQILANNRSVSAFDLRAPCSAAVSGRLSLLTFLWRRKESQARQALD